MRDFISEIKNLPTDAVITRFSTISIKMLNESRCLEEVPVVLNRNGLSQKGIVGLSAWDILDIVYLSVKYSNDYRKSKKKVHLWELVSLYRDYENKNSAADMISDSHFQEIFKVLFGMTSEQFKYQKLSWIIEKFNRDYYILVEAENFEHRGLIDANEIATKTTGYSSKQYIMLLLAVYALSLKNVCPILAFPSKSFNACEAILTQQNISDLIAYYSCTYDDLRQSSYGKQMLYSKPFIKTQKEGICVSSNAFTVAMLVGNGLYWLIRDYFRNQGQDFPNSFGLLFEDYVKDISNKYCEQNEFEVIPKGNKKGADFIFFFDKINMIIEAKTSLLGLDAKQQVPNLETISNFFKRTIEESYEQVNNSYEQYKHLNEKPTAKIVLLYDENSNSSIVERANDNIFLKDLGFFVMTIRELEILLYLRKNDKLSFDVVQEKIVSSINADSFDNKESFDSIFNDMELYENKHLKGNMDFFGKTVNEIEREIKNISPRN